MKILAYGAVLLGAGLLNAACEREKQLPSASEDNRSTYDEDLTESLRARESGAPHVQCNLSVERAGSTVVARLVFENRSNVSIPIPHWTLLDDGKMTCWAFEVVRDRTEVPYECAMAKRLAQTAADKIVLDVEAKYSSRTTISECYDFTAPGRYRVHYRASISIPDREEFLEIVSNTAELTVP